MLRVRTLVGAVLSAIALAAVAQAGDPEASGAPLYAAALIHLVKVSHCTVASPCCYSVHGKVPPADLKRLLDKQRELRPIAERGACAAVTIDVERAGGSGRERRVSSQVGPEGRPFMFCTHTLYLKSRRWVLDPSKDDCPIY
jgi:hypothetical protein